MKNLLKKYPKFIILLLTFVLAYIIFQGKETFYLDSSSYFGIFFLGMFYSYGFTAAPATAILLSIAQEYNIFLIAFIAGFGSLIGDLFLFKLIRTGFKDEINNLSKEHFFIKIRKKIPKFLKKYLILLFGFLFIASPLPDEIGVSILAGMTNINSKLFSILSYILNTLGIFIILLIGKFI